MCEIYGVLLVLVQPELLPESTDPDQLAAQMQDIIVKNAEAIGAGAEEKYSFDLGALKSLHTDDKYGDGMNYTVSKETMYLLIMIGAIILITCCINFVNLTTAQALKRSKEVGVKKVLGSSRRQLSKRMRAKPA